MIRILVLLDINDRDAFKAFEIQAIAIMQKYGGRLVAAWQPNADLSSDRNIGEIHYLEFPSQADFEQYRQDQALLDLKALRATAIRATHVYVCDEQVSYE